MDLLGSACWILEGYSAGDWCSFGGGREQPKMVLKPGVGLEDIDLSASSTDRWMARRLVFIPSLS